MFRGDGELIWNFSPELKFKFFYSARAGYIYHSPALSSLATQLQWRVNASLHATQKSSSHFAVHWMNNRKIKQDFPRIQDFISSAEAGSYNLSLCCSVSAKSLWSKFFEVGQKWLWTGESEEQAGWGAGWAVLIPTQSSPSQAWIQQIHGHFLKYHHSFYR